MTESLRMLADLVYFSNCLSLSTLKIANFNDHCSWQTIKKLECEGRTKKKVVIGKLVKSRWEVFL